MMRRPLFLLLEFGRTHAVRGLIVEAQRLTLRLRISIPAAWPGQSPGVFQPLLLVWAVIWAEGQERNLDTDRCRTGKKNQLLTAR